MIRPGDIARYGVTQWRVAMVWPEHNKAMIFGKFTSALVPLDQLTAWDNHSRRAS